jgi:transcriptional regulator with AAA-type ATPase domain/tetratricopeptide (TPR) repeat protein
MEPGVEPLLLPGLLGNSPKLAALRAQVERLLKLVAAHRAPPILIQGETGSGKGLLARQLHEAGRSGGPFVAVNCAAIPESLLEAELFGFERGAFTDARQPKAGLFQAAHQGTLFLDEIALLHEPLQAKLLTAIEDGAVRRLGSTRSEPISTWIIAASNQDLVHAVRARRFREDLYHRLAVIVLALPPLRARGTDILLLADRFLARACRDYGLAPKTLSSEARAALLAHAWPGNVRELANTMERVALLTDAPRISAEALNMPVSALPGEPPAAAPETSVGLEDEVDRVQRARLREALDSTGWNVVRAAAKLGISRSKLRYRLDKYGLHAVTGAQTRRPTRFTRAEPSPLHEPVEPSSGSPVAPSVGVRWESRHLAFLYASLAGSDAPVADPGGVLPELTDKVRTFGATLQDLSPVSFVAVFGLEPVEDAPQRAALAAIALRKTVERARGGDPQTPAIRVAVHAAHLLVGRLWNTMEIELEGKREAWRVLTEIGSRADAGSVLMSEAAAALLERGFELDPADPNDALRARRLVQRERTGFGLGGRPLSRFVGRTHELETLLGFLAQAERGRGQVVTIVGEPGVGKSRLLYELTRSERLQGWRVLGCGSVSHGLSTPYLPLVELLRRAFGVEEADAPAEIGERVAQQLRALDPALTSHRPALLALLEVPVDDAQWQALEPIRRRGAMREAIRQLLLRASQVQPLLVLVEDLHWVDSETQATLDRLVESLPTARILLVGTHRPEYRHPWAGKTYYSQLRLDPLPPEHAQLLLRSLLGAGAELAPLAARVIERTEGNPFFLEESVRSLIETQAVAGQPGDYRLAGGVREIEVPPAVEALLVARIDRLSPDDRQVLQSAAVIGTDVPLALLAAVHAGSDDALDESVARLQAAEFLYEKGGATDAEYTFKHALTHEVAYGSLPGERRRGLHRRIVEALEMRHPDQVERLGHHALRGEIWDKTVTYLRQAGEKAAGRSAYREAAAAYEQALMALGHLPESRGTLEQSVDLRSELRASLQPLMDLDRILPHLVPAEGLAESLGDRARLGRVLGGLCNTWHSRGELERAVTLAARALELGNALGDTGLQIEATIRLGAVHYSIGNYSTAAGFLRQSLELMRGRPEFERLGFTGLSLVLANTWLANSLSELGQLAEARIRAEEGLRVATSADQPFSLIAANYAVGALGLLQGHFDRAAAAFRTCVELSRTWDIHAWAQVCDAGWACALALQGERDEATRALETASTEPTGTGVGIFLARRAVWFGEAARWCGRPQEATHLASEALRRARAQHERGDEAWALRLLGDLASDREQVSEAEGHYRDALIVAETLDMRPLAAHCHQGLGLLSRRTGTRDRACHELGVARDLYREMGMTFWLERTDAELIELG